MLISTFAASFKKAFPAIPFTMNEDSSSLIVKSPCEKVGSIEVQDDDQELIVIVGNFTHWHAACYEDQLSEMEREEHICSSVIEFLSELFDDKIVMWGSQSGGGGFYHRDEAPQTAGRSWLGLGKKQKEWVWSGKFGGQ